MTSDPIKKLFKALTGTLLAAAALVFSPAGQTQMAQSPMLTLGGSVPPNLMFVFDDSGSMDSTYIYQYGVDGGGFGYQGPDSLTYAQYSADFNYLYYDPKVSYKPRIKADGTRYAAGALPTGSFKVYFYRDSAGVNRRWTGENQSSITENKFFGITTYAAYTPAASLLAPGATTGVNYVATVPTTGTPVFPKFAARTDCAGNVCTLTEERQNYGNWNTYYKNRNDMAQTAVGEAFQPLGATFRLGWAKMAGDLSSNNQIASGVGLYDDTRKSDFLTWFYAASGGNSTPGRTAVTRAGKYFTRQDNSGPWADNPVTTSTGLSTLATSGTDTTAVRATHLSCRRSFTMFLTDGYYNDGTGNVVKPNGTAIGNVDRSNSATITGTVNNLPVTYTYTGATASSATYLYRDSDSNTMADVAMYYWVTDLRPDLPNKVKPQDPTPNFAGNPSFWQNVGFYSIGLGIFGSLPQTASTLTSLKSGSTTWPSPSTNDPTAIDDMWHATVNGRGKFISAGSATEVTNAIKGMLTEINKATATQSGVAASTLSLVSGTRKFTPRYTTGSWVGNVVATNLDPASGAEIGVAWQVTGEINTGSTTVVYNGIPNHATRKIYTKSPTGYGDFNASNTNVTSNLVGSSTNLINFLRGDDSNEETADGVGPYRNRDSLLGDIVNSTPVFIDEGVNMSYEKLPAGTYGQASYQTFYTAKKARSEGVLFVGANDGMLHGFRGSTGAEVFAFVPRAVIPNMHLLANKVYDHRYFVDGPNIEQDACFGSASTCTWTNLLIGTAGAGAKSIFAFDVTSPLTMTSSAVLWEIDSTSTGFANLGHILSDVQTGLAMNGQWVAVFGNGYESADGVARLYVVNLQTGALIREISTGVGGSNGLGGVKLLRDNYMRIVGAYAGDLKGKLWKFDLSNTAAGSWSVGLSGSPLYDAGTTQPITAPPTLVDHPSGGYVVAFGTGKFYQTVDATSTTTQALYGVWDSVPVGTTTTPSGVTQTGLTNLVQQTISSAITGTQIITNSDLTTSTVVLNYYSVSRNPIDWSTKRGWYINLPNSGQRVIYPMETLIGPIVAVDTMSPDRSGARDPCVNATAGRAWNYVIDMLTGAGPSTAVFDTNGNGKLDMTDMMVSGYENSADGRTRYIRNTIRSDAESVRTGVNIDVYTALTTQQLPDTFLSCATTRTCTVNGSGGLVGSGGRNWRQLFLR
jgi:type IV pilus assembly protein PilY1